MKDPVPCVTIWPADPPPVSMNNASTAHDTRVRSSATFVRLPVPETLHENRLTAFDRGMEKTYERRSSQYDY